MRRTLSSLCLREVDKGLELQSTLLFENVPLIATNQHGLWMKLVEALKGLFLMPSPPPKVKMRCIAHNEIFDNPLEMSFHETMNLNCKWERLEK